MAMPVYLWSLDYFSPLRGVILCGCCFHFGAVFFVKHYNFLRPAAAASIH